MFNVGHESFIIYIIILTEMGIIMFEIVLF